MKILLSILFVLILSGAAFGQSNCPVTLSQNNAGFSSTSNNNRVAIDVTAADNCTWTATRSDSWVELNGSETQNTGTATFSRTGSARFYILAAYNSGEPRQTTVTVNDQTIAVLQRSGCNYSVPDFDQRFDAAGGSRNYPTYRSNGGPQGCRVTYTTDVGWIQLGATDYTVDANTSAARNGTIFYNYGNNEYRVVYVSQAAGMPAPPVTPTPTPACAYVLGTTNASLVSGGGQGLVDVQTQAGCNYSSISNNDFITITNGNGTGSGTVTFSVTANTGAARTGTLFIAGQTFTVNQLEGCTYTPSASSESFAASGGNGGFTIQANGGCQWNAVSQNDWITINLGSSWSGSGTVGYMVAPNTATTARTGTITVAGQTFTVNQAAAGKSRKRVRFF